MLKAVICTLSAVILMLINTIILFMKPAFEFAQNDDENYSVYYQKWIRTIMFIGTLIAGLIAIKNALDMRIWYSVGFLSIECILVIIYAITKYMATTVIDNDKIIIKRLFGKEDKISFDDIIKVTYYPCAKAVIKAKRKISFDVPFNSENFYKFYLDLIEHNVVFKTMRVPKDESYVCLDSYKITIHFPKNTFREYYRSKCFFRNSEYLFSARNLEENEYVEGYRKVSGKTIEEFLDLVKNDLALNKFSLVDTDKVSIDGMSFYVVKSLNKKNKKMGRFAYVHRSVNSYLVLYADYLLENEEEFVNKLENSIKKTVYEDNKNSFVRVK